MTALLTIITLILFAWQETKPEPDRTDRPYGAL